MRWREAVASVCGIDLRKMEGYDGVIPWSSLPPDPIHTLLNHSDCAGEIAVADCLPLAERLESLLPALETYDATHPPGGHLRRGCAGAARLFAAGLRAAAAAREPVEFF